MHILVDPPRHSYIIMHVCVRECVCMCVRLHSNTCTYALLYGVAAISRLLKIIGLFCRIVSLLQGSFAKETYIFKQATNRSHPISENAHGSRRSSSPFLRMCNYVYIQINIHTHVTSQMSILGDPLRHSYVCVMMFICK